MSIAETIPAEPTQADLDTAEQEVARLEGRTSQLRAEMEGDSWSPIARTLADAKLRRQIIREWMEWDRETTIARREKWNAIVRRFMSEHPGKPANKAVVEGFVREAGFDGRVYLPRHVARHGLPKT